MSAPKPSPRPQNWQVQDLKGNSIEGENYTTKAAADAAALRLHFEIRTRLRVRRTA